MKLTRHLRRSQGYTIDQTILIVAIIAILVTLIIITVGWNLINKSSGTKLAAQFRQIEDANGQFYAAYRTWPEGSYSAPAVSSKSNMLALYGYNSGTGALTFRSQVTGAPDGIKNFISGFKLDSSQNVVHGFGGSAGSVVEGELANPFGLNGTFLVVEFNSVPFSDAQQAEYAIDGQSSVNFSSGRVVATAAGTDCITATPTGVATTTAPSTLVNACYAANMVQ